MNFAIQPCQSKYNQVQGKLIKNGDKYVYAIRVYAKNVTSKDDMIIEHFMDNIPYDESMTIYYVVGEIIMPLKPKIINRSEQSECTNLKLEKGINMDKLYYIPEISLNEGNKPNI